MFHVPCINQMFKIFKGTGKYTWIYELHNNHRHVSTNHVAIFRVMSLVVSFSLCRLYHLSPIWITIRHMYRQCTPFHRTIPHTTFWLLIFDTNDIFIFKPWIATKKKKRFLRLEWFWYTVIVFIFPFLFMWPKHICDYYVIIYCKSKAVPLQAWSGPEGSRKLRFQDFITTAQDGGNLVSLTHRPPLPPRKCSWYSFLLGAGSTPGS